MGYKEMKKELLASPEKLMQKKPFYREVYETRGVTNCGFLSERYINETITAEPTSLKVTPVSQDRFLMELNPDAHDVLFDENIPSITMKLKNGDRWITADLADTGSDNFIALVWDGFHVIDMAVAGRTTPRQNADILKDLCIKHKIPEMHVIFDATGGIYLKDYMPTAIAYYSNASPMGVYMNRYMKLKDECYGRLCTLIKEHSLSFSEDLANKIYSHPLLSDKITVKEEFKEECACVKFKDDTGIRRSLITKREMRKLLGKFRSPDLLDPCAMRMMPILRYANGEELIKTSAYRKDDDDEMDGLTVNVFDETTWC